MTESTVLLQHAQALLEQRELAQALECFQIAEQEGADARSCLLGRWMTCMLDGDFEAAWRESDRARSCGLDNEDACWRGEKIEESKVIVRCLHGFGDAVQFFRYAPFLRQLARQVVWEVPPQLMELAGCFEGVERVVTWNEPGSADTTMCDVQLEAMKLPYLFRTKLDDLPIVTGYLHLPEKKIRQVETEMGRRWRPRVGVVWAAGEWNPSRSLPIQLLNNLLRLPGCEFWNLQGGPGRREWNEFPAAMEVRSLASCQTRILDLACVISQLDLVVTVDTLAAHLAGALRVPAWVMLQHAADWRWMIGREDSPWYPSLRLFRQDLVGDWEAVVGTVEKELKEWLRAQSERSAA